MVIIYLTLTLHSTFKLTIWKLEFFGFRVKYCKESHNSFILIYDGSPTTICQIENMQVLCCKKVIFKIMLHLYRLYSIRFSTTLKSKFQNLRQYKTYNKSNQIIRSLKNGYYFRNPESVILWGIIGLNGAGFMI
jgi:hypothetical protein